MEEGVPAVSRLPVDTPPSLSAERTSSTLDWESIFKLSKAEASTFVSLARWAATSCLPN